MSRSCIPRLAALAAATACALPSTASALEPVDLQAQADTVVEFLLTPEPRVRLTAAGDFDGDGHDDVLITSQDIPGEVHLLRGPLPVGTVRYDAPGYDFTVYGAGGPGSFTVARAIGDFNGDGFDDFVLYVDGRKWVVLGGALGQALHVDALGSRGFEVSGGFLPEPAGDVNGDGRDDLAVPYRPAGGGRPRVVVVLGRAGTAPVDVANVGTGGFSVLGISSEAHQVDGHGRPGQDFNGDGLDDLVVGSGSSRIAHVVFGRTARTDIDLTSPGAQAVRFTGPAPLLSTVPAGDVNGDGRDDVLVVRAAQASVVYGRTSTAPVNVASPGTGGFVINKPSGTTLSGGNGPGDVDGDGRADVLVTSNLDTAWLVLGRPGSTTLYLASLGARGMRIDRVAGGVHGVGDVLGDDRADLGGADRVLSPLHDAPAAVCTRRGTAGPDTLVGTAGPDVLCGMAGNDTIRGLGGNDVIYAGLGNDIVEGGDGEDVAAGAEGADRVLAGAGDDRVSGGTGADTQLDGGTGEDLLSGGDHNDIVRGGADADRVLGFAGTDQVFGDGGADEVQGEAANDVLGGGLGDDLLYGGPAADRMNGDEGDDRLQGDRGPMHFTVAGEGPDVIRGGPDDDRILGEGQTDLLYGDAGNDRIDDFEGRDRLEGGDGDDELNGGERQLGGAGNDTMRGRVYLDGGPGDDSMLGSQFPDQMLGGLGDDFLYGNAGVDTIRGGYGADVVEGGGAADYLYGDAGADRLEAGDRLRDTTLSCGADRDSIRFDSGVDVPAADCEERLPI